MKQSQIDSKDAVLFGLGLAGGAALAAWLVQRPAAPRRMPNAAVFQAALEKERGLVGAAVLVARVEERYAGLYARRPRFAFPALADHLEGNILPGLAVYQELLAEGVAQPQAYAQTQALLEASFIPRARFIMGMTGRVPGGFTFFRRALRQMMASRYPESAWQTEWVEDNRQAVAFNLHTCFYLDVLRAYGAPELTPVYCHLDDVMYEYAPPWLKWARTQTLGRGAECCDFRWENLAA